MVLVQRPALCGLRRCMLYGSDIGSHNQRFCQVERSEEDAWMTTMKLVYTSGFHYSCVGLIITLSMYETVSPSSHMSMLIGIVDCSIVYFCLIKPITLSTCVQTLEKCLAALTSTLLNCYLPLVKGGFLPLHHRAQHVFNGESFVYQNRVTRQ